MSEIDPKSLPIDIQELLEEASAALGGNTISRFGVPVRVIVAGPRPGSRQNAHPLYAILNEVELGSRATKEPRHRVPTKLMLKPFRVPVDLINKNVCGGVEDEFTVSVLIETFDLDGDGFVTHNMEIMDRIKIAFSPDNGALHASCEHLAAGVVHIVHKMVGDRLVSVNARVKNLTGHVDVSWDQRFPVPPFPQKATANELEEDGRYEDAARLRGDITSNDDDEDFGCGGRPSTPIQEREPEFAEVGGGRSRESYRTERYC